MRQWSVRYTKGWVTVPNQEGGGGVQCQEYLDRNLVQIATQLNSGSWLLPLKSDPLSEEQSLLWPEAAAPLLEDVTRSRLNGEKERETLSILQTVNLSRFCLPNLLLNGKLFISQTARPEIILLNE
jgi:hypothetical protein